MDYLDKLIEFAQIEGKINILCRFHGDWQVDHAQSNELLGVFHIVSKGQCCLQLGGECFHLKEGDVVFLPYGSPHILSHSPSPYDQLRIDIQQSDFGAFTLCANNPTAYDFEMFCGTFQYKSKQVISLVKLPQWYLSSENQSVLALLNLLRQETETKLGNKTVINAISNVLFTYLIRDYLEHSQINEGILGGLQDPRLSQAINAMLQAPEKEWSMESLAECCAMSRATFIKQFKEKTDMLAGQFLTGLRMQKAEKLLMSSQKSIQQIAVEVGYKSEAHFSKVFKLYYHCTPKGFRERE